MAWRQQISAYDVRAEVLQQNLDDLLVRQLALETELADVRRQRSVLSAAWAPWRLLPLELTSDIFVVANDGNQDDYNLPMILLLVCTEWQAIAYATPRLWTHIRMTHRRYLPTARIWLERSKQAPVSITYKTPVNDLALVASHLNHTISLDIGVDQFSYNEVVMSLSRPSPMLRALKVYHIDPSQYEWSFASGALGTTCDGGHPMVFWPSRPPDRTRSALCRRGRSPSCDTVIGECAMPH